MGAEKRVPLGESYNYLKKSIDNLNNQQSSGPAPKLYPDANQPTAQQNPPQSNNSNSDNPQRG